MKKFGISMYIYIYIISKHSAKSKKYISLIPQSNGIGLVDDFFLRDPIEGNIFINISNMLAKWDPHTILTSVNIYVQSL